MKKITAFLLVFVMTCFAFLSCKSSDELSAKYNVQFFRDGYDDSYSLIFDEAGKSQKSENFDKLGQGGHLPIHKVESLDELKSFRDEIVGSYISDGLKEYFDELDKDFFDKNILLAVNLVSGSGSYRFRASSVTVNEGCFTVGVSMIDPEGQCVTDDMAYWLVLYEVSQAELDGVTAFDAVYE